MELNQPQEDIVKSEKHYKGRRFVYTEKQLFNQSSFQYVDDMELIGMLITERKSYIQKKNESLLYKRLTALQQKVAQSVVANKKHEIRQQLNQLITERKPRNVGELWNHVQKFCTGRYKDVRGHIKGERLVVNIRAKEQVFSFNLDFQS